MTTDSPLQSAAGHAGQRTADAFKRLGNETRLAILLALWESYDPFADDAALSFSALRKRVGTADSGQFNYHLDQLTDQYVAHGADGYELTQAGLHVVATVVAGTGTSETSLGPVEVDETCPLCGESVEIQFGGELITARCTACAGVWADPDAGRGLLFRFNLPPAGVEGRTPTEVFRATVTYNLHRIASFRRGVCPNCAGAVDYTIDVCDDHERGDVPCPNCRRRHLTEVLTVCTRCKTGIRDPLFMAALMHPAVTAFYYDHGLTHQFDTWNTFARGQTVRETLVDTDPLQIRVTVPCHDDELHLLVDEALTLVPQSE